MKWFALKHHKLVLEQLESRALLSGGVQVSWPNPANIQYGTPLGPAQLDATANVPGTFTYSPGPGTILTAGDRIVTLIFSPADGSDNITDYVHFNVNQAALLVSASSASSVYGSPLPDLAPTYVGLVGGDTPDSLTVQSTLSTDAQDGSPVGDYSITLSGAADPNYTISYQTGTLSITPAPMTITADNQASTYGGPLPNFTATCTGFVNGDTSLATPPVLSASTTVVETLYHTRLVNGVLVTDTIEVPETVLVTAASPVGTYDIAASGAADPNYTISYVDGTLNITPAPLTITANDASQVYGGQLPQFTATYSGLVNGDTPASLTGPPSLTAWTTVYKPVDTVVIVNGVEVVVTTMVPETVPVTASTSIGTYQIVASGAADPNYNITYQPGALTITPAPLLITANDATEVYGGKLPQFTATYTGLVNGDAGPAVSPILTTTARSTSPVGVHLITAYGAADPNYSISYAQGVLSITPASLLIVANNASMVQGSPLPALTVDYSGLVNGDTPACLKAPCVATPATNSSPAGAYPITVSGAADPNYAITYAQGVLTVNTPPTPPTTVNQAQTEVVPVGRLKQRVIMLHLSGPVNSATASSTKSYKLTHRSKYMRLVSATYKGNTIQLRTRLALPFMLRFPLTLTLVGLTDAHGNPIGGTFTIW